MITGEDKTWIHERKKDEIVLTYLLDMLDIVFYSQLDLGFHENSWYLNRYFPNLNMNS